MCRVMTDRDRFELEMSPGMQPPGGLGDRVLAGLALLVLIGAAVIVAGKVLPDPEGVAQGSAEPSSRPEQTPRPRPTPEPRIATIEDPDVEVSPPQNSDFFFGWVRALSDVVIRSAPQPDATEVGVLQKGEFAYATEQDPSGDASGWLNLEEFEGWIASVAGGVEQVHRYEYPRFAYSGDITNLLAGPEGFVAMVRQPSDPNAFTPTSTASSIDGDGWRSEGVSLVDTWDGGSIAWGPAGWLAATYLSDEGRGRIVIWSSADGLQWTRLGMLGGINSEFIGQFLGTAEGYLLETHREQSGYEPNGGTLWFSADGLTWVESKDPALSHSLFGERRISALHHGFYLWDTVGDPVHGSPYGAFSADGRAWSQLDNGPDGVSLQVTDFEGGLVAIDMNRTSLAPRVWSGVLDQGRLSWIRDTASDGAFAGGVVRQLVSDNARVFAFGWDLATEEPMVWSTDGTGWLRTALPESFGGIPALAAAGPAGVVVVGHRHTLRGDNPVFWHRTASGRWVPESDPIVPVVPDPTRDACPQPPSDLVEFMVVDAPALISCQGAAPFTFRAYSFACDQCYGTVDGNPQPAWLLNPTTNMIFLAPGNNQSSWSTSATLRPSLEADPAWLGTWIEVTGHYDDPEALTCRQDVTADSIEWWLGRYWLIDQCRTTFVVSDVKIVSGP